MVEDLRQLAVLQQVHKVLWASFRPPDQDWASSRREKLTELQGVAPPVKPRRLGVDRDAAAAADLIRQFLREVAGYDVHRHRPRIDGVWCLAVTVAHPGVVSRRFVAWVN